MADAFFVRDTPTPLIPLGGGAVDPALAGTIGAWAFTNSSHYPYMGPCDRADSVRDAGKLCSIVTMLSHQTASVLVALVASDGGAIVTVRRGSAAWSVQTAIPFGLPITRYPPATATPPSSPATPIDTVRQYYQLLTQQDWMRAWQFLSAGYHTQRPYEVWVGDFTTIPYLALASLQSGSSIAHVVAYVDATITTPNGPQNQQWITDWYLTQENGTWKLDTGIRR
ncbi:MAG: hypothetical protein AB7R89_15125 [Dehalococcoidia bacterium]